MTIAAPATARQKAMTGYNQLKSLVGFKATMSDWAALDAAAAVAWMRERYKTLPLNYVGHSFGGQALGLLRQQHRGLARPLHRGAGRLLETDGLAGTLSRLCHAEFRRPAPDQTVGLRAGLERARRRTCPRACSSNGSAGS